jgi:ATP-binding cassette subfamily B protein/subfamily B ATP-binding cassette protein MsbA
MVLQPPLVFPMSVRDNIAYGRPNAGDDEIVAAARLARIHDLVKSLPQGYDTVLGDGATLSEGEKQRLTIARAILRGAPILVLDEPTSWMDVRGEADFFERFLEITAGLTTIIISHRFSTVRLADDICVLDEGGLAEHGSHDELLAAGGRYARMFTLQALRFVDEDPALT